MRKIVIDIDGSYIDVSKRKGILWGSGKFAHDIMERYNFNDIEIVVDRSMEKWGRVFKDDYVIKNPCILHDLKPEMYFIIVASLEYKQHFTTFRQHAKTLRPVEPVY